MSQYSLIVGGVISDIIYPKACITPGLRPLSRWLWFPAAWAGDLLVARFDFGSSPVTSGSMLMSPCCLKLPSNVGLVVQV